MISNFADYPYEVVRTCLCLCQSYSNCKNGLIVSALDAMTNKNLMYNWDQQDPVTIINEFMLPELILHNYSLSSYTLSLPGSTVLIISSFLRQAVIQI